MRDHRILITGSEGLVGSALRMALEARGAHVTGLDLRGSEGEEGDVRDAGRVRDAADGCHGIVHLAAVSRVVWGEREPETCREVNVGGLRNVIAAASAGRAESSRRPWVVFASSREVYGQPGRLPVTEDAPLRPINVYGRSKVEGERLVEAARDEGLRAAIVRLSNVYGSTRDHPDRVVPAFARGAVTGSALRVEGADHTFDFTHIDDTTRGISSRSSACWRTGRPRRRRFTCSRAGRFRSGGSRRWRWISPGPGRPSCRRRRGRSTSPASTATRRAPGTCSAGRRAWSFGRASRA